MKNRYTITIKRGENVLTFSAKTHADVANKINNAVGYFMVSRGVVVNWLTRGIKSNKYDFIDITAHYL